jgi:sugar phosphate isomerase/epimerase
VNHFLVMLPDDPMLPRADSFGYMVESFSALAPVLEQNNARIAIEGWPGPGALCCTPEGYRAFFTQVPSQAMGVNYDPSHLIRQGIDHLRFLREFATRVYHVHGKDTEILTENVYEYGTEQPPTFGKPLPYAGMTWRYTIPGHGVSRWVDIFRILQATGYEGCVSIELEDANFHRVPEAEQAGILNGASFLAGC